MQRKDLPAGQYYHTEPEPGDVFVRSPAGSMGVEYGLCTGKRVFFADDGSVSRWEAAVEPGFTPRASVISTAPWRVSEWHRLADEPAAAEASQRRINEKSKAEKGAEARAAHLAKSAATIGLRGALPSAIESATARAPLVGDGAPWPTQPPAADPAPKQDDKPKGAKRVAQEALDAAFKAERERAKEGAPAAP